MKVLVLMHADDAVILCDNEKAMRRVLPALHSYCSEWKLTVNCNTTKTVVFNREEGIFNLMKKKKKTYS